MAMIVKLIIVVYFILITICWNNLNMQIQNMKVLSILIIITLMAVVQGIDTSFNFPASFTVVRRIIPPVNIDSIFQKLGCCQFDSNGQPNGYNIVSLDGLKSISTTASI